MTGRNSVRLPHDPGVWRHSTQTYLLLQDFDNHVVPYRNDGDAYELSVEGISSRLVKEALSLGSGRGGVASFISEVAVTLLTESEACLEVVFNPDVGDRLPFRALLARGVKRTATGKLIQGEPQRQPERIEPDNKRLFHVGLPDKYPSRLLAKICEDLAEVDSSHNPPPWVMEHMTGQRMNAPAFDSGEAMRTERLRIAQATLPIGWTAREIYYREYRHLGDYYYYWRELRFLLFRSSMRERAEEALQQVLTVAGAKCSFEASVTARGLYTPDEVEEVIKKYEAGDISLSAVNDIIFERPSGAQSRERLLF